MVEPDQAVLEGLGMSFYDLAGPGSFCTLRMAGECSESKFSVSPWPSCSKFLFRNLWDCCTQLVMAERAVSRL